MSSSYEHFPTGRELQDFLNLSQPAELDDLFDRSLFAPLDHLLGRPGKNLRSQLVRLGYRIGLRLSCPDGLENSDLLAGACKILELVHAGSLIVDDIEDGSENRRGAPSVHNLYGVPVALNAGNWLYFLTFRKIDELPISESARAQLLRECHRMLLRAHFGQALDVGISIDSVPQHRLREVTLASIELKSGVLAGFALKIGSLVAGATEETASQLDLFGRRLGVALQMYDDIGNLSSSHNAAKALEDLKLKRLSFVVATAAQKLEAEAFGDFSRLVDHAKKESAIEVVKFLKENEILELANSEAEIFLESAITQLEKHIPLLADERKEIENYQSVLRSSYE